MKASTRVKASIVIAALAVPALAACPGELCCTESDFKVGGTITADIEGSAQSQVAVQAVADFAGIAAAAVDDITNACRSIAQDLDAPKAEQDAIEDKPERRDRLKEWCALAVKQVTAFKAVATANGTATLELVVEGPKCSASISAKASCQAKCSASGECNVKAETPRCTGGKLEIACKGECTGMAGAAVSCEGTCGGTCKGECTAEGGVQCAGQCDGSCSARDAQGNCNGTCNGTCKATAPTATCSGSCKGSCEGKCTATATASVKCDGTCSGDFEPLRCEGGKLEGGCKVEAKCDANCDASVSAKAECTPPRVTYKLSAAANAEASAAFGQLKGTFETNLPLVFSFLGRLEVMDDIAGSFVGNVQGITDIKTVCIPVVLKAVGEGAADVKSSVEAAGSITASAR